MRKRSLHLMFFLVVLLVANFAVPSGASGQQQRYYPPYELYKFYMNGTNGYWYAPWYSIGVNAGYTYQGPIGSGPNECCGSAGIYPRVDEGYTPAPSTGLVPLYQWTVFQGARSYTYLSTYYASHGSGYYFNGVMGYVYPTSADPNNQFTTQMVQWYSQSRGFWYGRYESRYFEFPPDGTYVNQGIVCKLPPPSSATAPGRCTYGIDLPRCDGSFSVPYDPPPPPPPPPTCDPNDEQWCYNSGGWWDSGSCTCNWS
jgi:hypothetical protein